MTTNLHIGYHICRASFYLMERLEFDEAIWQDTHDEALLDSPERTFEPHLFESQLRQLTAAEIENALDFMWDFLCEQQAYAATNWEYPAR